MPTRKVWSPAVLICDYVVTSCNPRLRVAALVYVLQRSSRCCSARLGVAALVLPRAVPCGVVWEVVCVVEHDAVVVVVACRVLSLDFRLRVSCVYVKVVKVVKVQVDRHRHVIYVIDVA